MAVDNIDDLDDSSLAEGTVRFGLDGTHYEIDLNATHAQELRTALARYTQAARKVTGTKANGFDIKDRGRVPADVIAKFRAATGN